MTVALSVAETSDRSTGLSFNAETQVAAAAGHEMVAHPASRPSSLLIAIHGGP